MMAEETAKIAEAMSNAATGPGEAAKVHVSRPSSAALWCQIGALVAACIFAAAIIAILAWKPMPEPATEAHQRIWFIGWMGLSCIACIALSGLSQFFSRVDASAGPAHIDLGGR